MKIADGDNVIELEELAIRICDSYTAEDCDTKCPAKEYCHLGHTGMIDWLRKVLHDE